MPGGKGINVSIVLKNLGIDNTALGFVAGFTGKEVVKRLEKFGAGRMDSQSMLELRHTTIVKNR